MKIKIAVNLSRMSLYFETKVIYLWQLKLKTVAQLKYFSIAAYCPGTQI